MAHLTIYTPANEAVFGEN